jgi:hypothetical protein
MKKRHPERCGVVALHPEWADTRFRMRPLRAVAEPRHSQPKSTTDATAFQPVPVPRGGYSFEIRHKRIRQRHPDRRAGLCRIQEQFAVLYAVLVQKGGVPDPQARRNLGRIREAGCLA